MILFRFDSNIDKRVFRVLRETKRFYIIYYDQGEKKVAKETGRRNFAYLDEDLALEQFFYRKRKQVIILQNYLKSAQSQKDESFKLLTERGKKPIYDKPKRLLYEY